MSNPAHDDEDEAPARPRWLGWALAVFMALVVIGVFNVGWRIMQPASGAALAVPADPQLAAGKRLVESSDCMRCHGLSRQFVGPAYQQIADRYRERSDALEHLARKIREGSVGEWGRTIMPRHPQITAEQSQLMAGWLLSLPPGAP